MYLGVVPVNVDVDLKKLRTILCKVLNSHFAHLNQQLKDTLKEVAAEMFAKNLIPNAVNENPTYNGMINQFKAGMEWKKSVSELKKHCQFFLDSLSIQAKDAAKTLASEWKEEVKKELGISLDINVY